MNESDFKPIEDTDLEILQILSEDGRKSFRNISEVLHRSPVTIKRHVEDLEQRKIIKDYGIKVDYEKLGYNLIAFIEITISKGKMIKVEKMIAEDPHVFGVYDITGTYDAIILARFKSRQELSKMVKKIHTSEFVERTNTHLVLNIIKEGSSLKNLLESDKDK